MYIKRDYSYICADKTHKDLFVYYPENYSFSEKLPAIIIFFGGGFRIGSPADEIMHAAYFAHRGMIAVTPDYRVYEKHKNPPSECAKDAKLAVSWVYDNADILGVDKEKIIVGGGSAGGHLAVCTSLLDPIDPEDIDVSTIPKAHILHNPVLDLGPDGYHPRQCPDSDLTDLSPVHHLKSGLPPTVIFHGTNDKAVSYSQSAAFCSLSTTLGNSCVLHSYPGKQHGFSAYAIDIISFADVMQKSYRFLEELGLAKLS